MTQTAAKLAELPVTRSDWHAAQIFYGRYRTVREASAPFPKLPDWVDLDRAEQDAYAAGVAHLLAEVGD